MSAIVIAEVAKLLLTGYFTYTKQQGLSEEETQKVYNESKAEFEGNTPDKLEDV